ncbi:FKBP-type peptidyl-prolyl cis-trans isomerase [Actinocorallia sp. A-T 12471]|uniref:FKBP-type peptidyl-prolyl cis-trans isomerase n=1 Tax=Actinocorallia sp. A-T 12471 TaxID=3089813 RepID=UPI0029D34A3D|nr:FKBP-type peptidyl-prolyl cis-trans isomerase [Actinocorallia sp. A-T 12471]MDX6744272.1 FKBP-type peptidyl-prolyl cis-trans isomerase [Actinocorallia sp. A-T 12471]
MRRLLAVLSASVLVVSSSAGCGGGPGEPEVEVSGEFGVVPSVEFPRGGAPGEEFAVETVVEGEGRAVAEGDLVVADYVGYTWASGGASKLIGNSFQGGTPAAFPSWNLVPGLKRALVGAKAGSRVVAVIPPKDGYGTQGSERLGIAASDSLVYVLDVRGSHPKGASVADAPAFAGGDGLPEVSGGDVPGVRVPKASPPKKLTVETVKTGPGREVKAGDLLAIQYVGALWRDGKVFSSSWSDGKVYAAVIGQQQVIKGWDEALVGKKVGSRLLVVAPPDMAYGAKDMEVKGLPKYGIKASDTLVYVIDVLGAY